MTLGCGEKYGTSPETFPLENHTLVHKRCKWTTKDKTSESGGTQESEKQEGRKGKAMKSPLGAHANAVLEHGVM